MRFLAPLTDHHLLVPSRWSPTPALSLLVTLSQNSHPTVVLRAQSDSAAAALVQRPSRHRVVHRRASHLQHRLFSAAVWSRLVGLREPGRSQALVSWHGEGPRGGDEGGGVLGRKFLS
jgi:hypothetical protein